MLCMFTYLSLPSVRWRYVLIPMCTDSCYMMHNVYIYYDILSLISSYFYYILVVGSMVGGVLGAELQFSQISTNGKKSDRWKNVGFYRYSKNQTQIAKNDFYQQQVFSMILIYTGLIPIRVLWCFLQGHQPSTPLDFPKALWLSTKLNNLKQIMLLL